MARIVARSVPYDRLTSTPAAGTITMIVWVIWLSELIRASLPSMTAGRVEAPRSGLPARHRQQLHGAGLARHHGRAGGGGARPAQVHRMPVEPRTGTRVRGQAEHWPGGRGPHAYPVKAHRMPCRRQPAGADCAAAVGFADPARAAGTAAPGTRQLRRTASTTDSLRNPMQQCWLLRNARETVF